MKSSRIILYLSFLLISASIVWSCSQSDRQIVPYDTDIDEIFVPLPPNDEDSPGELTFGQDSIFGVTFDYEITTQDSDVYIYFSNITLLRINPQIADNLFNVITTLLQENDFISSEDRGAGNLSYNKLAQNNNYNEAAISLLDSLEMDFQEQLKLLQPFPSAFNFNFQVYPVFLNNKYITYRIYGGCYTGGAHGQTFSYLKTYELSTGKLLTI